MALLNIGIIEDELIIARTIISTLDDIGYSHCGPAISYTEGLRLLETNKPDVLLLDIQLSGKKDGIDLATIVNEKYKLPFIFLTANSDAATIERAKRVSPHAYIVKPFTKEDLFTAIEIAFSNFTNQQSVPQLTPSFSTRDYIFVKDGYRFQKVMFSDILYLQSEHNYVSVFLTDNRRMMVRSQFNDFIETLPSTIFKQAHRSYVVNIDHVKTIEPTELNIATIKIPLSASYKIELMKSLGIE